MKFYRLSDATIYDQINTIYQFIKPFLDKKCLFLSNMEPLNNNHCYADSLSKAQNWLLEGSSFL